MPDATSLASFIKALRRTLDASGVDSPALFRAAGLDPQRLDDPEARFPVRGTATLWRLAREATGDPAIGLAVAEEVNQTTFHALGYSLLASASLRDAFERIVRYSRIVSDAAVVEFESQGGHDCLRIRPSPGTPPADEAIDAIVAVYVRFGRMVLGRGFSPLRVRLARPQPPRTEAFERVLRAPIEYGAGVNELWFEPLALRRPLDGANPVLARLNEQILVDYLAQHDRRAFAARVRAAVVERLPQGEPVAAEVAQALNLSLRSLQRRLSDEGTSFDALLTQTRRELAQSYLAERRYSVSQITYLLGFSDTSSFTRAFKRWTGQAPSAYAGARR